MYNFKSLFNYFEGEIRMGYVIDRQNDGDSRNFWEIYDDDAAREWATQFAFCPGDFGLDEWPAEVAC